MFGRSRPKTPLASASLVTAADMGLDTLAAVLRMLGEMSPEHDSAEAREQSEQAEDWAQHVLIGSPPPGLQEGTPVPPGHRRDWAGVREFVRATCRGSLQHAASVLADLRQVV